MRDESSGLIHGSRSRGFIGEKVDDFRIVFGFGSGEKLEKNL